ncbi:MAG: hypothetical protein PHH36_08935 [Sideroxydans sp.]|nr:hypothetical protein [Sideroxydans sp.]
MNDTLTIATAAAFESLIAPPAMSHRHAMDFKTFCSLRRMVAHQRKQWVVGCADFMPLLTMHLPEVAEHVDESDFGYIHLEVGVLKLASRQTIMARDMSELLRHLILVSDLLGRAEHELRDALRISYLEALFLNEAGFEFRMARSMLPQMMEMLLQKSEARMKRMCAAV